MTEMVHFSFALSPRMRAFIELRDALACLETARSNLHGASWLHAACDLRASLLGDQGRKTAIPEINALLADVKLYLNNLSTDVPHYRQEIQHACEGIDQHIGQLQQGLPDACNFLSDDAMINAYLNTQKKHDWLSHKLCMQQSLKAIWSNADMRTQPLHQSLSPLVGAVNTLDHMLNDFVGWQQCVATGGTGQITPERGKSFGLLVIALSSEAVAEGIVPDISGNRLTIRLRFQQWPPGQPPADYTEDIPYAMMLVPVGC